MPNSKTAVGVTSNEFKVRQNGQNKKTFGKTFSVLNQPTYKYSYQSTTLILWHVLLILLYACISKRIFIKFQQTFWSSTQVIQNLAENRCHVIFYQSASSIQISRDDTWGYIRYLRKKCCVPISNDIIPLHVIYSACQNKYRSFCI